MEANKWRRAVGKELQGVNTVAVGLYLGRRGRVEAGVSRDRAGRRYAGVPDLFELAGKAGWASVSSTSTLEVGCFPFAKYPTSGPRDDEARAADK